MQSVLSYIQAQLSSVYGKSELKSVMQRVLESVFGLKPYEILLCKDKKISPDERKRIEDIVSRLKKNEPVQYVLGETEFYGMVFKVNNKVLIPRPETEELVDWIIQDRYLGLARNVLDIGTGSGCIAVSLSKHLLQDRVYAIDISGEALQVARQNALLNDADVRFILQDVFMPFNPDIFPGKWDVIVSNPPYITYSEQRVMSPNVLDYEPSVALFVPDENPLLFYEKIAGLGLELLSETGALYVETSALWGQQTAGMFREKGYEEVVLKKDLSGNDRMIKARLRI